MEGSLIHGISVPPARADQASQLLRTDARKLGYYIRFENNNEVKAAKLKKLISRKPVSLALKEPEYGNDTALGRFLRSKEISSLTAKYSHIVSLSVHERQYLATPETSALDTTWRLCCKSHLASTPTAIVAAFRFMTVVVESVSLDRANGEMERNSVKNRNPQQDR